MLMVLATISSATSTSSTGAGSSRAMLRASPWRVCQPIHALMIWIAAMNGSVRNMVQVSA